MIFLNLADLFVVIIAAGSFYSAKDRGLLAGIFSFVAMIIATFITLHYYGILGDFLIDNLLPQEGRKVAFFLIAVWTLGIFSVIRRGWVLIAKINMPKWLDKWGGNLFYLARGCLLGALVVLGMFSVDDNSFVMSLSRTSLSGYYMKDASYIVYQKVFNKVVHPFFSQEKLNEDAYYLIYPEKKKKEKKKR